jgi:hypothetical protein
MTLPPPCGYASIINKTTKIYFFLRRNDDWRLQKELQGGALSRK